MSRAQRKFLKEAGSLWPLAKGSLAKVKKPCSRPNCQACRSGAKHEAFIFVFWRGGKRRCMHVCRELAPVLRKAIGNGRKLQERLCETGEQLIREYRGNR